MIGEERAKGFFLRLGYQSGLKDAELARKLRPNGSDMDMFLIGPQLHSLKGMVNVRPVKKDIDSEAGIFYADIEWIDSFEVENHQSEQLHSDQPICWMLLGYAISYSSFFIGRQIIYKEVSCRGCGDKMCRIIGKPAEEWEDADTFMRYSQSDSIIDELHTLQLQVENMNQRLQLRAGQFYGIGRSAIYRKTCELIDKLALGKRTVLTMNQAASQCSV